jgi:hypothetical protein
MNETTKAHLDKINNINTSPELVAVIQYDEGTKEAVCLLNNQTIESGGEVDYRGTKFPVAFAINGIGSVPDEDDHDVEPTYISIDRWDPVAKTIVSYTTPVYAKRPGRTVVGADVVLSIDGIDIKQEAFYRGRGSHVVCKPTETSDGVAVVLDRFAFTVPNTVWGFKPVPHPWGITD